MDTTPSVRFFVYGGVSQAVRPPDHKVTRSNGSPKSRTNDCPNDSEEVAERLRSNDSKKVVERLKVLERF